MTKVTELYDCMVGAVGVADLSILTACVKFYKQGENIPTGVLNWELREASG